jgi:hypothetical protein
MWDIWKSRRLDLELLYDNLVEEHVFLACPGVVLISMCYLKSENRDGWSDRMQINLVSYHWRKASRTDAASIVPRIYLSDHLSFGWNAFRWTLDPCMVICEDQGTNDVRPTRLRWVAFLIGFAHVSCPVPCSEAVCRFWGDDTRTVGISRTFACWRLWDQKHGLPWWKSWFIPQDWSTYSRCSLQRPVMPTSVHSRSWILEPDGLIRQKHDPWCEGRSWIYLTAGGDGVTFTHRSSGHVLRCHIKQYKVRIRVRCAFDPVVLGGKYCLDLTCSICH